MRAVIGIGGVCVAYEITVVVESDAVLSINEPKAVGRVFRYKKAYALSLPAQYSESSSSLLSLI